MQLYRKTILKYLFWLTLLGLWVVSSIPDVPVNTRVEQGQLNIRLDYLLHLLAYATIGLLYSLVWKPGWKGILLLLAFSIAEEGHQYWIPGRTLNPVDWIWDITGLLLAIGIMRLIHARKKNQ